MILITTSEPASPACRAVSRPRAGGRLRTRLHASWHAGLLIGFACLGFVVFAQSSAAQRRSQPAPPSTREAPAAGEQADAANPRRVLVRFLTSTDFPPFNAPDEDGTLSGLNVDVARAICLELSVTCDVQTRAWDDLIPALLRGEADALIAGHAMTPANVARMDFTQSYFNLPGRFAAVLGSKLAIGPEGLSGRRVAVAKGTAHAAYLKDFFRRSEVIEFASPELAREALLRKEVEAVFDDGASLAFWVNGALSRACCELTGGAYFEPRYFGSGLAIGVKLGERDLRASLDGAIERLRTGGRLEELIQRHFPIRVY